MSHASTKRTRRADIYREAAIIVGDPEYVIANGCCGAIARAVLGKPLRPGLNYDNEMPELQAFNEVYCPEGWWHAPFEPGDRDVRIMALCFLAAMAERP